MSLRLLQKGSDNGNPYSWLWMLLIRASGNAIVYVEPSEVLQVNDAQCVFTFTTDMMFRTGVYVGVGSLIVVSVVGVGAYFIIRRSTTSKTPTDGGGSVVVRKPSIKPVLDQKTLLQIVRDAMTNFNTVPERREHLHGEILKYTVPPSLEKEVRGYDMLY